MIPVTAMPSVKRSVEAEAGLCPARGQERSVPCRAEKEGVRGGHDGFPHWFPEMKASANSLRVGITGLGVHVPERVLDNDELSRLVDTTDEWIVERTGIRERRIAADDEAFTDIALPAARAALDDAGARRGRDRPPRLRDGDART